MSENTKDEIIEKAYKDFFGSITDTFKEAKKLDKSIKLEDVKKWFNQKFARKTRPTRKTRPIQNSYIANYAYQEYQMDLFFMPDSDGEDYNTGLLLIDIFTTFATVVPVKSKQADDILEAIKQGFKNMGKLPEMLYTDDEGSFHSKQAVAYYRDNKIKHLITRTHAAYAERAIRTIKAMLYKRLEAKPGEPWYGPEVLSNALVAYNYRTKHTATNMTPNEARQPKNILEVKLQLEAHRLKRKRYPDVQPDSDVRVYTKKRNFQKERQPV